MPSTLSQPQIARLMKGHAVQIPHPIMGCGLDFSKLLNHNQKRIHNAWKNSKGVRIQLSPEEIQVQQQEGSGIFGKQFDKGLKKVGIKKGVFKTAKVAAPVLAAANNAVAGVATKAAIAAGHPELAVPISIAKNTTNNYMKRPTHYQNHIGDLAKDSGIQSAQELGMMAVKHGEKAYSGKGFSVRGGGFAAQRGSGFSLQGGAVANPYASNNFSMLNPLHPAIVHPLPPKRPDGYKNVN